MSELSSPINMIKQVKLPQLLVFLSGIFLFRAFQDWQYPGSPWHLDTLVHTICLGTAVVYYMCRLSKRSAVILSLFYMYMGFGSVFQAGFFSDVSFIIFVGGLLPAFRVLTLKPFVVFGAVYIVLVIVFLVWNWEFITSPFGRGYALPVGYLDVTWLSLGYPVFVAVALMHFSGHLAMTYHKR